MAYTYFSEVVEGRSGSVDQRYQRSYKRVFLVKTDSPGYGPYHAGSHPSLPLVWSVHPEDPLAYCVGFSVDQDQNDGTLWRVTANYAYNADSYQGGGAGTGATGNPAIDTQQQGQPPQEREQSPLLRPRDYQVSTNTYNEALLFDANGEAICNSGGDPFLPAPERQRFTATLNIGLNVATAPTTAWFDAVGKINHTTLVIGAYTMPPKTARLNSVNAQRVYENGIGYYRWTLVFEYKPSTTTHTGIWTKMGDKWPQLGWRLVLLNMGKRRFTTDIPPFGGLVDITKPPTFTTVTSPVFLDNYTQPLPEGEKPYYKAFDIYESVVFPSPL
jgi:hypothetical protein